MPWEENTECITQRDIMHLEFCSLNKTTESHLHILRRKTYTMDPTSEEKESLSSYKMSGTMLKTLHISVVALP